MYNNHMLQTSHTANVNDSWVETKNDLSSCSFNTKVISLHYFYTSINLQQELRQCNQILMGVLQLMTVEASNGNHTGWLTKALCQVSNKHTDYVAEHLTWFSYFITSGNHSAGSRFYPYLVDTWADSICIHQLILKPRSKAACIM